MFKDKKEFHRVEEGADVYGSLVGMKDLQIKKWQRIAYTCALTTLVCVGGVIFLGTRSQYVPYIVHVDENTGYVHSLGSLTQSEHKMTNAEVNYFLRQWITDIRTIPTDPYVLKANITRATSFMTPEAGNKFKNEYLPEFTNKVADLASNRIEFLSFSRLPDTSFTYQCRWKEITTSHSTNTPTVKYYVGTFVVRQEEVKDKEVLKSNPLGIFITNFDIVEEEGVKK